MHCSWLFSTSKLWCNMGKFYCRSALSTPPFTTHRSPSFRNKSWPFKHSPKVVIQDGKDPLWQDNKVYGAEIVVCRWWPDNQVTVYGHNGNVEDQKQSHPWSPMTERFQRAKTHCVPMYYDPALCINWLLGLDEVSQLEGNASAVRRIKIFCWFVSDESLKQEKQDENKETRN